MFIISRIHSLLNLLCLFQQTNSASFILGRLILTVQEFCRIVKAIVIWVHDQIQEVFYMYISTGIDLLPVLLHQNIIKQCHIVALCHNAVSLSCIFFLLGSSCHLLPF